MTPSSDGHESAGQGAGVRVEQPSLRVEALALRRVERAIAWKW